MQRAMATADATVQRAVEVARQGDEALFAALDDLAVAVYVTDVEGIVRYFNPACIDFAGRTPVVGADRWCVTWRLYTEDGEFIPHDRCPMAVAIQEKRPVRGGAAVAERPDGERRSFVPFPTPLLDDDGELRGAVNLLLDVTAARQATFLRLQAQRCRRLAKTAGDQRTTGALNALAVDYETKAGALDA
jgi:PAS domain-containing protein